MVPVQLPCSACRDGFDRLVAGELPEPNLPMMFQLGDIGRLPDEHIRVLHIAGPSEALVDVRSYEGVDEGGGGVGVVGANYETVVLRGLDASKWVAGEDYELKGEFEVTGRTTYGALVGKNTTQAVLKPFDRKRLETWVPAHAGNAGKAPR